MFIKEGKNNELLVTIERWIKDNNAHSKQATKQENTSFERINNQSNKQEESSEKSPSVIYLGMRLPQD